MAKQLVPVSPLTWVTLPRVRRDDGQFLAVDRINIVDPSGGAVNVHLPSSYGDETVVLVVNPTTSTNAIIVHGNGSTIDGEGDVTMSTSRGVSAFMRNAESSEWTRVLVPRQIGTDHKPIFRAADIASAIGGGGGAVYGPYADRPAPGVVGRLFVPSDGGLEWVDTGADWRPRIGGKVGKQPPLAAAFSTLRGGAIGGTYVEDRFGAIEQTWSNTSPGGERVRALYKAAPAPGAIGYRVKIHVTPIFPCGDANDGAMLCGLGFRDSATGNIELLHWALGTNGAGADFDTFPHRLRYTANNAGPTPTYTFVSQVIGVGAPGFSRAGGVWMCIERDATTGDRRFYWSPTGVGDPGGLISQWREVPGLGSLADDFITPDEVVLHAWMSNNTVNTAGIMGAVFDSYEEESFG